MKPRTPGFWLIVATVGLLTLLPMKGFSQSMTPADAKRFGENNADAFKGHDSAAEQGNAVAQYMLGAFAALLGLNLLGIKMNANCNLLVQCF